MAKREGSEENIQNQSFKRRNTIILLIYQLRKCCCFFEMRIEILFSVWQQTKPELKGRMIVY